MQKNIVVIISLLFLLQTKIHGQIDTTSFLQRLTVEKDLLNLSLLTVNETLIHASAGGSESLFHSSNSVGVVTAEMLQNSSVSSIAEALSLVPGVMLRQLTNGNFEVNLRGNDYIQKKIGVDNTCGGKIFLVLINGIPFNNLWDGAINWAALPVSLSDVERIEVYRNPQSASLGSEAIVGAVNILTKTDVKNGVSFYTDIKANNNNYVKLDANLTAGINDKIKLKASSNYFSTRRFEDNYYILNLNRFIPSDSLLFYQNDVQKSNKFTNLAIESTGVNIGANYLPIPKLDIWLNVGQQNSKIQIPYTDSRQILLSQIDESTTSIQLNARVFDFSIAALYKSGTYNPMVGVNGDNSTQTYSYLELKYPFVLKNGIKINLGSNFQHLSNDNTSSSLNLGLIPVGRNSFTRIALFGSGAYNFNKKMQAIGSLRYELMPGNYTNLLNVQASLNYQIKPEKLWIVNVSINHRPANFIEIFSNEDKNTNNTTLVNRQTSLSSEKTYFVELAFRKKINTKLHAEIETYYTNLQGGNTIFEDTRLDLLTISENIGATGNLNYKAPKFEASVFLSLQYSNIINPDIQTSKAFTPTYFGGFQFNMTSFYSKLKINICSYVTGKQVFESGNRSYEIAPNIQSSIKVSYRLKNINSVYINFKNIGLNNNSNYPVSDKTKVLFLLGINFNLTSI